MMETTRKEREWLRLNWNADDPTFRRWVAGSDQAHALVPRALLDVDTVLGMLRELVERLDCIHENEEYKGVWVLYHVHGGKYEGPTYTAELAKARAVLGEPDVQADG